MRWGSAQSPTAKANALAQVTQTRCRCFCAPRARRALLPANPIVIPFDATWQPLVAKTHYAVNEGDYITNTDCRPGHLAARRLGELPVGRHHLGHRHRLPTQPGDPGHGDRRAVMHLHAGGEICFGAGIFRRLRHGYDQSAYSGVDLDLNRWVLDPPWRTPWGSTFGCFGMLHPAGCYMAFCDGLVRLIGYQIDAEVHRRLGNRRDGLPVDSTTF